MTTKTIASVGLALILTATAANVKTSQILEFDRHDVRGYAPGKIAAVSAKRSKTRTHKRRHQDKPAIPANYASRPRISASLTDVTPALAVKARELIEACGAKVISGYRAGSRIAGSRHASLHARYPAEAVDMTGDTSCIYPRLKGWPGGFSVDYAAARHIHISMAHDRRERGARFTHYGTRRYARR